MGPLDAVAASLVIEASDTAMRAGASVFHAPP